MHKLSPEFIEFMEARNRVFARTAYPYIENVIFNDPATIVFWSDGTKTVVKCHDEVFDPEKGLAMAICKKTMGNNGRYYNIFKEWIDEDDVNMDANVASFLLSLMGPIVNPNKLKALEEENERLKAELAKAKELLLKASLDVIRRQYEKE